MFNYLQVSPEYLANVAVDTATAASNVIVAPKSGYFVRVISGMVMSAGTTNVTFEDNDGTNISGAIPLIANVGFIIPECSGGAFDVPNGKGLNLLLSAAIQVSGWIRYQYVKNRVSV